MKSKSVLLALISVIGLSVALLAIGYKPSAAAGISRLGDAMPTNDMATPGMACDITCPANITRSNDPNQCGAVVFYPPPTTTGMCGTVSCSPASGSFFPVGTTTVTCTVAALANSAQPLGPGCPSPQAITHSTSQAITPLNSVSCNNGFGHTDNSYYRAFTLSSFGINDVFDIESIDIGIEGASSNSSGSQPLTINLYTSSMPFPTGFPGSLTLIGTTSTTVADQSGTILNIPVTGTAPAGSQLVVEVFTPNGEAVGNLFFIGSNTAAETGPSYLRADDCGITTPTTTSALGFPNMHIVINVNGCEQVTGGSPSCSFNVRVFDTQPPLITCPANITAVTSNVNSLCVPVTFAPTASDNCPGVMIACNPPSGSCFPVGVTTVTCTATDTSGNTSTCSFTVSTFNVGLEDDSEGCSNTVLFNTLTGDYRWCCHGTIFTGVAEVMRAGDTYQLTHDTPDRRVLINLAAGASPPRGNASLQFPPGTVRCILQDHDIRNDNCGCGNFGPCMIICPADIVQENDPNQCGAVVGYSRLGMAGTCGPVICSPPRDTFFPVGTTTVTCTVSGGPACAFTVTVNDTQPPIITCPANVIAAMTGPCTVVTYPSPTASDNCPGATMVCAPPSGTCFAPGTTTVNCMATDTASNTATCSFTVGVTLCPLTCPANITTISLAGQCGAIVNYQLPAVAAGCSGVMCSPASGSFFAVGTTPVTCVSSNSPACLFNVTVNDLAPVINCPLNITTTTLPGKANAVVDYATATATDNCGIADIVCLPPSGAVFPLGVTRVMCMAKDSLGNTTTCSFSVTINDSESPSIQCPPNVTLEVAADQTSAIVTYPAPIVTDNLPGATMSCAPPSGSTFALGATTVTCTAMDTAGHPASCSFLVNVNGGPPGLQFIIPGGKAAVEFGKPQPVPVKRKVKKAKAPCGIFTIENTSFASIVLTFDAIIRIGSDVDSGLISDPREASLYALSLINDDGSEMLLNVGETVTLAVGERKNFCLRVNLVLPGLADSSTNLSALQVIPDPIDTRLIFKLANGNSLVLNVNVHIDTAVRFINPDNPRRPATPSFTASGNEFVVAFAVFDPNLDLSRATYEFFDASGAVVAGPFEIDLVQAIRERHLVRGQSFAITQRFTGASTHPEVAAVRVTIFDSETSVTSPVAPLGVTAASVAAQSRRSARLRPVVPPPVRVDSSQP